MIEIKDTQRANAVANTLRSDESIKLLNDHNLTEVYKLVSDNRAHTGNIPILTALFLNMNINPLEYMENVPVEYGARLDVDTFKVPEGIRIIKLSAFMSSKITNMYLPDGVKILSEYSFAYCHHLTRISLPNTITHISRDAFAKCENLSEIEYRGTITDWKNIKFIADWNRGVGEFEVKCLTGTIHYK